VLGGTGPAEMLANLATARNDPPPGGAYPGG
jgi:hypothetical protein